MKKITIYAILISLILISACTQETCKDEICFEENCFKIEIPKTQEEMIQGLMFREYLPENEGMLFIFGFSERHSFWMKNTLMPLDMIWLDEELKVVYIQTAVPCTEEPCTIYAPNTSALYTLEINAGLSQQRNINIGNQAELKLCS